VAADPDTLDVAVAADRDTLDLAVAADPTRRQAN
jgi:hypothetical protein